MAERTQSPFEDQRLSPLDRRAAALTQCDELIRHFERRANRSKRLFEWLRYATVVLTVAVASIAAIEQVPRWVVAAVSALAALCTAMLAATRPQEVWLQSRGSQQQLTAERFLFEQRAGSYAVADDEACVRLFAEQIMRVWSSGHSRWEEGRRDAASQPVVGKT